MKQITRALLLAACFAAALYTPASSAPLVLTTLEYDAAANDSAGLVLLDPENYSVLQSFKIGLNPFDYVTDAEQRYLYVLSAGKQSAWDLSYRNPASISAFDLLEPAALGSIELGSTPVGVILSADGSTLVAVTAGRKKSPSRVTTMDPHTLEILSDVETGDEASSFHLSPDGHWAYVLQKPPGKGKMNQWELVIVDTREGAIASRKNLAPGSVQMKPGRDGEFLYVLYGEHPGTLMVLATALGKPAATLEIPYQPGFIYADPESEILYIPSRRSKTGPGALLLVRGAEIVETYEFRGGPYAVSGGPVADSFFLLENSSISLFDLKVKDRLWSVDLEFTPFEVIMDRERRWLYTSPLVGSAVARIDLEKPGTTRVLKTGRPNVKAGQVLTAIAGVAAAAAGYSSVIVTPGHSMTNSLLGPDDEFLYISNARTNDVTVIAVDRFEIDKYIKTGKGTQSLYLPPGSPYVVAEAMREVTLIDTSSREVSYTCPASMFGPVHYYERMNHLLVPRPDSVGVINMATGKEDRTLRGIHKPHAFLDLDR